MNPIKDIRRRVPKRTRKVTRVLMTIGEATGLRLPGMRWTIAGACYDAREIIVRLVRPDNPRLTRPCSLRATMALAVVVARWKPLPACRQTRPAPEKPAAQTPTPAAEELPGNHPPPPKWAQQYLSKPAGTVIDASGGKGFAQVVVCFRSHGETWSFIAPATPVGVVALDEQLERYAQDTDLAFDWEDMLRVRQAARRQLAEMKTADN